MKYCRDCGAQILDNAEICPNCGCRQIYPDYMNGTRPRNPDASTRSRLCALLLCIFFGVVGVHRFYLGRTGSGVAMVFLGWLTLGIWPLIDLILIACGNFRDGEGRLVTEWDV